MLTIAPSLLAADFADLASELKRITTADMLHIDVMDGHFVPNISIGPAVVEALRHRISLPFDVHLMLDNPMPYIETFRKAGADIITIHAECGCSLEEAVKAILASGAQAGIALKPATPVSAVGSWGALLAQATIMTVEPGFGGQKMHFGPLEKVKELKARFPQIRAEVDGGVNRETALRCKAAGIDILVAGTSVFRAENPEEEIEKLRRL